MSQLERNVAPAMLDTSLKVSNLKWQIAAMATAATITVTGIAVAALLTVFGWLANRMLNRKFDQMEREELKKMEEMAITARYRIEAVSLNSISVAFWQQHDGMKITADSQDATISEKERNLEAAIYLAETARDAATRLDIKVPEHERLVAHVTASNAYYLADAVNLVTLLGDKHRFFGQRPDIGRHAEERRQTALDLAREVFPLITERSKQEEDLRWMEWMESYCWTLWSLGDPAQKDSAKTRARDLHDHPLATESLRSWIRERYFGDSLPS